MRTPQAFVLCWPDNEDPTLEVDTNIDVSAYLPGAGLELEF